MRFTKSNFLSQRALNSLNLEARDLIFFKNTQGARIYDADDQEYLDYSSVNNIVGHAHPDLLTNITQNFSQNHITNYPNEQTLLLAEQIKIHFPHFELINFTTSYQEALNDVISIAQEYTEKSEIIFINDMSSPLKTNHIVVKYNNFNAILDVVESYDQKVAAIVLEPIIIKTGLEFPDYNYLHQIRSLCDREGILLIFDESYTAFRIPNGGAQQLFHITPDLTLLGSFIGGGFPLAAYAGESDLLKLRPANISINSLILSLALMMLKKLTPELYHEVHEKTVFLTMKLNQLFQSFDKKNYFHEIESIFSYNPQHDLRDQFHCDLYRQLLIHGIYLGHNQPQSFFISSAHTQVDLEKTIQAFSDSLKALC